MAITATLIDGDTQLELRRTGWDTGAVFLKELDLGFPTPREDVSETAAQDGVDDRTAFFGARTVTASLTIKDGDGRSIAETLDVIRGMCAANKRVRLVVARDGWDTARQVWLRATTMTCLISRASHVTTDLSLTWTAPAGVLESTTATEQLVVPLIGLIGMALTPGAAGSEAFEMIGNDSPDVAVMLEPGTGQNSATLTNAGNLPAVATFTVFGPVSDPEILLRDTGQRLAFDGFSIPAGSSVVVDVATRKVTMAGNTVYQYIDWGRSTWFTIPTGTSTVQFGSTEQGVGAYLAVTFRPRFL